MRDWENLRYFLAVARSGTVSGAAKHLGVSHSTVLRRIEQFEQALDATLFKKLQRGYVLTSAGEKLFADAKLIETDIDQVFTRAEGHHDVAEGKLRISQPENGIIDLHPLYAAFLREHPGISLEIHSTMSTYNLNQQEVDVAFRFTETPPDLLIGRRLAKIKTKVYASRDYLVHKEPNTALNNLEWVLWETLGESTLEWLNDKVGEPNIVLHSKNMPDILSAIRCGMGAGFLSSNEAEKYPELVPLLGGKSIRTHDFWMLTHRDLRNSERVTTFMRYIADNLSLD